MAQGAILAGIGQFFQKVKEQGGQLIDRAQEANAAKGGGGLSSVLTNIGNWWRNRQERKRARNNPQPSGGNQQLIIGLSVVGLLIAIGAIIFGKK